MKRTLLLLLCAVPLLASFALASNPQDEQMVRTAYAKLAYAAQSHTVYDAVQRNQNLKASELTQRLQDNELSFDITDMSSGAVSEIASKAYTDFVARPDGQDVLSITHDTETFDEKGQRFTSYFAVPHWVHGQQSQDNWDVTIKDAMAKTGNNHRRYVTATITVSFQGRSRAYHTLWLFGSSDVSAKPLAIDLVAGQSVIDFGLESTYPSVLTDTSLRSRSVVNDWLNSTQRFDASCKTGKQDVCCDSAMRCGVHSEDLRSTKPAPNTTAVPKKEGL